MLDMVESYTESLLIKSRAFKAKLIKKIQPFCGIGAWVTFLEIELNDMCLMEF